ncbi:hypothetical protein GCM10028806_01640 [Spirosoma terrae]
MGFKGKSSSQSFLNVYWKNICTLFLTSKKFNKDLNLIFFTNTEVPETVDSVNIHSMFAKLSVKIIQIDFEYKTPSNYYGSWRNTFFEFSIIKSMIDLSKNDEDVFLLLDSDCIVTQDLTLLWSMGLKNGFLGYSIDYPLDHVVNGLSRQMMKEVYEELDSTSLDSIPNYYGGEFLLSTIANLKKIFLDFEELWPKLLMRNENKQLKFNTEEHVLSYLFYKNKLENSLANRFIKRMWTQPFIHRNVVPRDEEFAIWHLPHEKKYGIITLFSILTKDINRTLNLPDEEFFELLKYHLTIPSIPNWIYISRILPVQIVKKIYLAFSN